MNKLTKLWLSTMLLVLCIACEKKEDPEPDPITDENEVSDTSESNVRYDMVDFDLNYTYTQGEELRPNKIITLGDKLWGIAQNGNDYELVSSNDPAGPWKSEYNNGEVLYRITKSANDEICIINLIDGFLVSTDEGVTWTKKLANGANLSSAYGGANISVTANHVLLGIGSFDQSALYISSDTGANFTKVKEGVAGEGVFVLAIDDSHFIASIGSFIYTSNDGNTWTQRQEINGLGVFSYHDYENNISYAKFNQQLWSSADFGETWSQISSETIAVKGKMPNGDLIGTRLVSGVGYEVVRSYSDGTFWLKLGGLARDVDAVSFKGNTVAADRTGIYVLEPGRTEWYFYPIVNPQFDVRNRGTNSVEVNANQLMVTYNDRETWQVTQSFTDIVSFHTRIGHGKIAVITQTAGFYKIGALCHVLNSSGTLIEETYSLPWVGVIDNFISDGTYIACIFHGEQDYIGYTTDLKNWSLLVLPTDFYKIHFLQRDAYKGVTIGFEGKNAKDFQEFTSTSLDLLIEDGLYGEPVNNATNGWPGFYEYDKLDAVHYGHSRDGYAIFDEEMYVYSPETEQWYKSEVYQTLDDIKRTILKTGFLNHSNVLTSPGAVSSTPFTVKKQ